MKKIKVNKFLLITIGILLSLLLNFLIASIGAYNNSLKTVIGCLIYFSISYYTQKKFFLINKYLKLLILVYPIIFIQLLINIVDYNETINSLPIHLFLLLACISGYFFSQKRLLIIPLGLLSLIIFYFIIGKTMYLNYRLYNAVNLSTAYKKPKVQLYDHTGKEINLPLNKFVILDFWNSKCAPCYREFPFIDSLSKIIDDKKYHFAIVNIPIRNETRANNYNLLQSYNYTFNKYFAESDSVLDSFKISSFPTTIVIKNDNIIYKGDFKAIMKKLNLLKFYFKNNLLFSL